jgi:integrase
LLSLRWADVDLRKRTVLIRAMERGAKKTARSRELPMSAKLAAILEMAGTDARTRSVHSPTAYVFGDGAGRKVGNIKRAWETAILKAHGHKPEWVRGRLSATSRTELATIDLHFHDLRHEAGCRWLENGVPLHHVQELLGHTNLAQTSTYLHASEFGLRESMRRYDVSRGTSVAHETATDPPPECHDETADIDKSSKH